MMNDSVEIELKERTKAPWMELADYRRRVAGMYARVRRDQLHPRESWECFRRERDALFATHPQSALTGNQKQRFQGLPYFPYHPDLRFLLEVEGDCEPEVFDLSLRDDGPMQMKRCGRIHFEVQGQEVSLSLYQILGYGGGLFLPFRDKTNDKETYGGGRYLLDTIKNVDLGSVGSQLVIDFNFAYNPSCAYNDQWHCPLAPRENWLPVPIRAGEKDFDESGNR